MGPARSRYRETSLSKNFSNIGAPFQMQRWQGQDYPELDGSAIRRKSLAGTAFEGGRATQLRIRSCSGLDQLSCAQDNRSDDCQTPIRSRRPQLFTGLDLGASRHRRSTRCRERSEVCREP